MKSSDGNLLDIQIEKFLRLSDDQIEEQSKIMNQQQPYLLDYFTCELENKFNNEEKDVFYYYCLLFWYVLSQREKPLIMVTRNSIIRIKEINLKLLYGVDSRVKHTPTMKLENLCSNFYGENILRTIANIMLEEVKDNIEIREETIGNMLFYMRIVVESMNEISIEESLMDRISSFFGIKL
jgi:hypothetical protein